MMLNNPLDLTFITYGIENFDNKRFKQINTIKKTKEENIPISVLWNKPFGGLWASPLNSKLSWKDFCIKNNYNIKALEKSFQFTLTKNAKIYIIDNQDDLIQISNIICENPYINNFPQKMMDFNLLINEHYDGIYATENAIKTLSTHNIIGIGDLHTWDCESLCIFNCNVIKILK